MQLTAFDNGLIRRGVALVQRHGHINWALTDQALLSGVNFLIGVLLARYLGAEEFGSYSLAWMVVLFLNTTRLTLIVSPMMSIGPQQDAPARPDYYGSVFVHQLVLGTATSVLLILGAYLVAWLWPALDLRMIIWPLALASFAFQFQDHLRRHFFAQVRPARAFVHDSLAYGVQIFALFALFRYVGAELDTVLWVIAGAFALGGLYGLCFVGRMAFSGVNGLEVLKRHWRSSKWLLAMSLLSWIAGNSFMFMAGALLGTADVGGLRVSAALIGVANILFIGLDNVVPVRAASLYSSGGLPSLWRYVKRVIAVGGPLTALMCGVLAAAPEFWVGLVYGPEYEPYAYLMRGYALAMVVMFLTTPLAAGLRAMENTRPLFTSNLAATAAALLLLFPLVRFAGAPGVVIGSVLVTVVRVGYLLFVWKMILRAEADDVSRGGGD